MSSTLETLRRNVHHVMQLPAAAQNVVDAYLNLTVDGVQTACPYHINPGLRSANRASLGKGSPAEIEALAARWFKNYAMHTGESTVLRSFLQACGIGVDCSAFASWVLNAITEVKLHRPIWKCVKFPGLRRAAISKIRPLENMSARLLTGPVNSRPINDLAHVRPGDLIRLANRHHVVIITEVGVDKAGKAVYFRYAQSSCMYGTESGVRTGHAVINKVQGSLLQQQWFDNYPVSVIEELIREGGDDSCVVRLKALDVQQAEDPRQRA